MYSLITSQDSYEFGRHFVGLNSNRDFVIENEESSLSFEVIYAKDLFYMLATNEVRFVYGGVNDLSLDEVKELWHKLANRSYHHSY